MEGDASGGNEDGQRLRASRPSLRNNRIVRKPGARKGEGKTSALSWVTKGQSGLAALGRLALLSPALLRLATALLFLRLTVLAGLRLPLLARMRLALLGGMGLYLLTGLRLPLLAGLGLLMLTLFVAAQCVRIIEGLVAFRASMRSTAALVLPARALAVLPFFLILFSHKITFPPSILVFAPT